MWLIMVGLGLGWMIVMIPVTILLVVVGAMLGGFPALLVGGLASLFFEGAVPWILAAAVGIPIFILVVAVPGLFLGGLAEVFKSSVWTLTYRELRALESLETEPGQLPELDTPGLE
jgi:ABC-type spermidine/putrescine transport system permease subunit I